MLGKFRLCKTIILLALFMSGPPSLKGQSRSVEITHCEPFGINPEYEDAFVDIVMERARGMDFDFPYELTRSQIKRRINENISFKNSLNTRQFQKIYQEQRHGYQQQEPGDDTGEFSLARSAISLASNPTMNHIPVKVILYPDQNGNFPLTEAQVLDRIGAVNDDFRRNYVSIRFYLKSISYSSCVSCSTGPDIVTIGAMFLAHTGSHFSVHVINTGGSKATYPWTPLPGSSILSVDGWPNVLTHEFGHSLGLYHTHRGRDFWQEIPLYGFLFTEIDNHDSGNCYQESVSRTKTQGIGCIGTYGQKKCDVNGDELCDTPGSPDLSVGTRLKRAICVYNWTGKDNWNKSWTPSVTNYMAYSGDCRNDFTPGQIGRMISYVPSYATTNGGYQISYTSPTGSNIICPGNTVTLTIPSSVNASLFAWHIPPGWTVLTSGLTPIAEEEGWMVYTGATARSILLRAPSPAQSETYWIGVNPHGENVKSADIQFHVGVLDLVNPYLQYCTGSQYTMESSLDATYSFSNTSWQVISGQGTTLPVIAAGTGSTTFTARYYCGGSGRGSYYQTETLNLTADPNCSGGTPPNLITFVNSAYPNPSDGETYIELSSKMELEVVLYSLMHGVLDISVIDESEFTVSLPDETGLYFLFLDNGSNKEILRIYRK